MTKSILYKNEMFPVRLVFLIDILLTAMSFVVSYLLCSIILPDILSHGMLIQLPIIVALTSLIFLFIGIYKGYVKYDKVREVYSIFNAICLTNILTIVLVVVNGKLIMEEDLMVPLSIIIVHSILSFTALAASRYIYKRLTVSKPIFLNQNEKSIAIFNESLEGNETDVILGLLKQAKGNEGPVHPLRDYEYSRDKSYLKKKAGQITNFYFYYTEEQNNREFKELLHDILKFNKPVYFIQLRSTKNQSEKQELVITEVFTPKENSSEKPLKTGEILRNALAPQAAKSITEPQHIIEV